MPVIAIAPNDELLEKLKSNLQEVKSRGSEMIVFEDENSKVESMNAMEVIPVTSNLGRITAPIIFSIPLQLLSYHVALSTFLLRHFRRVVLDDHPSFLVPTINKSKSR